MATASARRSLLARLRFPPNCPAGSRQSAELVLIPIRENCVVNDIAGQNGIRRVEAVLGNHFIWSDDTDRLGAGFARDRISYAASMASPPSLV